jgi:hypothetical protein
LGLIIEINRYIFRRLNKQNLDLQITTGNFQKQTNYGVKTANSGKSQCS